MLKGINWMNKVQFKMTKMKKKRSKKNCEEILLITNVSNRISINEVFLILIYKMELEETLLIPYHSSESSSMGSRIRDLSFDKN